MQAWLIQFGMHHTVLIYIPVIVVAMLEGPFLSVFFGILLHLGYFSFFPIYLALMLGDLIGDIGWYYIGYHYGRRAINKFGKRFKITEADVEKTEALFHTHKHKILFISKITNGFGLALVVLMTAGIAKIPFKRYLAINIFGQMIWSALLLGIGYFFSESYTRIESIAGKVFFFVAIAIVFSCIYLINKKMKKNLAA